MEYRLKMAWGPAQDTTFSRVKCVFTSTPVLHFHDFSSDIVVHTDASEAVVWAFLAHPSRNNPTGSNHDIMVNYCHRFSNGQRHYSATIEVYCAVV